VLNCDSALNQSNITTQRSSSLDPIVYTGLRTQLASKHIFAIMYDHCVSLNIYCHI